MATANKILFQVGDEVFEPKGELLDQYTQDQIDALKLQTEREAKPAIKNALLDRLGITADEAALLLG